MPNYSVQKRGDQWWIISDTERHGPYETALQAEQDAIIKAQGDHRSGERSVVTMQQYGDHVVFDTAKLKP